jgi:aspartyl-tRNA(Asn)/glutamyl-tRNA(Gln) amidotransferase subunit A
MDIDLGRLSATQIRDGIATGGFTATDVAIAAISRIVALEGDVHAFNQVTGPLALMAAERIDAFVDAIDERGEDPLQALPPLAGVPVFASRPLKVPLPCMSTRIPSARSGERTW